MYIKQERIIIGQERPLCAPDIKVLYLDPQTLKHVSCSLPTSCIVP